MTENEQVEVTRTKVETERATLRTLREQRTITVAKLAALERQRTAAARDPASYAEARSEEGELREECDRLALLIEEVQPAAIASAEKELSRAQWLAASVEHAAIVEREHAAYSQAMDLIARAWAALATLDALRAEASVHAAVMHKTGAYPSVQCRSSPQLADLILPKEHKLAGNPPVAWAIATRMRELLELPEHNNPGCGYPASRQALDMASNRYVSTLAEFAGRKIGAAR